MSGLIPFNYEGHTIQFNTDGWLNATKSAKQFDKEPTAWLRQVDTLEYLCFLGDALNINSVSLTELNEIKGLDASKSWVRSKVLALSRKTGLVISKAGAEGGTWLHPKLAVVFTRWLNTKFAVWCDLKIDSILHGDLSAIQQLDQATLALQTREAKASEQGRQLASWRWEKPVLRENVDYWREQVQLTLALNHQP